MRYCGECGQTIVDNSSFCPRCGSSQILEGSSGDMGYQTPPSQPQPQRPAPRPQPPMQGQRPPQRPMQPGQPGQPGQRPMPQGQRPMQPGQPGQRPMQPGQRPMPQQGQQGQRPMQPGQRPQQGQMPMQQGQPMQRPMPQRPIQPGQPGQTTQLGQRAQGKQQRASNGRPVQNGINDGQFNDFEQPNGAMADDSEVVTFKEWLINYLLLLIPIYGLIRIIILAVGGPTKKTSITNWARATLVMSVVGTALFFIITTLAGSLIASLLF